jgi:hypothetical protein
MKKRSVRLMRMAILATVLSVLLTGCGSVSVASAAELIKEHPWLAVLGLAVIKGLLERFGYDLPGLLVFAAALVAD